MAFPTHEQWMKDTSVFGRVRSDFLKKVDEAIKAYNLSKTDANKNAVKTAFDRWRFEQSRQGKDWRKNDRNDKGALTNLYRALLDVDKRKLTPEEIEAMKYIAHQQTLALQKQFEGRRLQFKGSTVVGMAQGAAGKWQAFKTTAATAKDVGPSGFKFARNAVKLGKAVTNISAPTHQTMQSGADVAAIKANIISFIKKLCPDVDPNQVFGALNLGPVETFAADLAPFVGAISSGGKAIYGWIKVADSAWSAIKIEKTRFAIAPGDPEAAFDALGKLLDREIDAHIGKASVATAAFTGKTLGACLDYGAVTGPAIGMLEVLAQVFQLIFEYVRDYLECKAANEMLQVGALNLDLFKAAPVLGCYFLVVQDHSTIVNFAVADYGTANWMVDVERLVNKIDPVLEKSRKYIDAARLEIPGMKDAKGVKERDAGKTYAAASGLSKVTDLPAYVKFKVTDAIASVFEEHGKVPKVDKARIVGFGSKP